MKLGRDYSWWVSYSWSYVWFDSEHNEMDLMMILMKEDSIVIRKILKMK